MKAFLLVFWGGLLFSLFAFSAAPLPINAVGQDARFYYFEDISSKGFSVVFTFHKACASGVNQAAFSVQNFASEIVLPASTSSKLVSRHVIRVLNLYGRYNSSCKLVSNTSYEQKFDVPASPDPSHIYVTTDPGVDVRIVH